MSFQVFQVEMRSRINALANLTRKIPRTLISRQLNNAPTKSYYIRTTGVGSQVMSHMENLPGNPVVAMDVPRAMGGQNSAPQPVEVFLASLCGCEQLTATFVARHMEPRIDIKRIDFEVRAMREERGAIGLPLDEDLPPSRLQRIWGTAVVHVSSPSSQAAVDILARHVKRRCPIANMVTLSGCVLDIEFVLAK